jgi:hypothetical protein
VVEFRKVCITHLFVGILSREPSLRLWRLERFKVERDSILCGLLNGDIDTFVVLNFGIKSCVSFAPCNLLFIACSFLSLFSVLDLGLLVIYYSS